MQCIFEAGMNPKFARKKVMDSQNIMCSISRIDHLYVENGIKWSRKAQRRIYEVIENLASECSSIILRLSLET